MKHFGKIILIIVWTILILAFGYYLVFNNLGSILTTDRIGFSCQVIPEGVRLRSGDSVTVVKLKFPLQLLARDDQWLVQTSRGTVSFSFGPKLHVQWKRSEQGRSSEKNGE